MPEPSTLAVFAVSTLALLLVPGPSVLFVVARTLEQGRAAGLISVLGLETGAMVHVLAAAAGVSALIASSPTAFTSLKLVGGVYLLWLGARAMRARSVSRVDAPAAASGARLFREGVLVDLLNPKTAMFFLAFLPGFVDADRGSTALQIAILGGCFVALATVSDGAYAVAASRLSRRLRGSERAALRLARVSAVVYVALGAGALAGVA